MAQQQRPQHVLHIVEQLFRVVLAVFPCAGDAQNIAPPLQGEEIAHDLAPPLPILLIARDRQRFVD